MENQAKRAVQASQPRIKLMCIARSLIASAQPTSAITFPIKLTHRHELCKDLIIWGHAHVEEELTLERVLEELHTTRASLSQGCKEVLGMGPMEVLRSIRLEHVYQALSSQQIREQLGCRKIEDIREHYGFNSRGNFAALYKSYFDESPRETLMKSKMK